MRIVAAWLLLGWLGVAQAAPSAEDYARSLGLRERWIGLTRDVAWPATWHDAGGFHYRKTVEGGFAFVRYELARGEREPAFDQAAIADALARAGGGAHDPLRLPFETFAFEDDGRAIAFRVGDARWRCTLAPADCALAPSRPGRPRAFGVVRDLAVPADDRPRRSPDGRHEATVEGHDVVVRRVADGAVVLRGAGGQANDFDDPETLAWSPDSRWLALYRVRPGDRREVVRVEAAPRDQRQPRVRTQLYPKPGDAVDVERPLLFDVERGRRFEIDTALFADRYRLSPIQWRQGSDGFAFEVVHRGHQRVDLIAVDVPRGEGGAAVPRIAVAEPSATFVDTWRGFRHDVGGRGEEILWLSERDGWRHLYLFDGRSGAAKRQLTRGAWVVREVLRVDEAARQVWFTASGMDAGRDPYFRHLFRVGFDGGEPIRLTEADADHDVAISPDGAHYVDVYSRVDLPPVMELRRADGALVAEIERGDIAALQAAGWRAPEPFVAKGRDGATDIWGLVVRPRDYDPGKRYPVIENIYAGPHDAFVPKTFWPFGHHSGGDKQIGMQALADLGFIVVQIDGMGTAHRGKAFHDVAWKNLGDSGFPDRIAWHRALAARDPSYDIGRGVGIYGASAGGQSALGALLFHPAFYTVAVAWNGCYDNRMDKISWNEQWMGLPEGEGDHYARASGVDNAHRLQGELLMILGEQDDNVDPASTMQVADALIRAGKDFDLLAIPGGGHAVGRSEGPIDYAHRRQFDFFVRHLQGAEPPRWNRAAANAP
ncbi:DPP IV N-terminal domain-containing protein [Luteimonas huabeiensis]|uniref:DPP IV N-terminal domain-containing protein n=1 Tax=Luteimonas huabeiensis TaxID=1244513 RepID=UPI0004632BC4|nr:DPP IV N-terminal domain-containing protein [Luteimonas huabeiensis]